MTKDKMQKFIRNVYEVYNHCGGILEKEYVEQLLEDLFEE